MTLVMPYARLSRLSAARIDQPDGTAAIYGRHQSRLFYPRHHRAVRYHPSALRGPQPKITGKNPTSQV